MYFSRVRPKRFEANLQPKEVVTSEEQTREQKIEILRRWEYDAHQMEVAEEEVGMALRRPELRSTAVIAKLPMTASDHLANLGPVH